jgi:cell wall-associated NlpC family hydrolase
VQNLRRKLVSGAVGALAATLVFTFPGAVPDASADPLSDAKAELARLEEENSKIDADYAAVQQKLGESRTRLKSAGDDLTRQQTKVSELEKSARKVALTQFQGRDMDVTTQLFTSPDADTFLTKLSTTQRIESNMNSTLQSYQTEVGTLSSLKKTVESETESIKGDEQRLKDLAKESDKKVKAAEALVSRLTAEQRAALAAEQQRTSRAGANLANSISRSGSRPTTQESSSTTQTPSVSGPASSRARGALNFAIAQVGKRYVMGAEGPNAYDCSGLVMAAYASVGISLPRTSQSQYRVGRSVSRSELQPGDLVFFYSGISHVGIYMGNGIMVDARNSRVGVVYTNINEPWWPYAGARRVA